MGKPQLQTLPRQLGSEGSTPSVLRASPGTIVTSANSLQLDDRPLPHAPPVLVGFHSLPFPHISSTKYSSASGLSLVVGESVPIPSQWREIRSLEATGIFLLVDLHDGGQGRKCNEEVAQ